MCLQYKALCPKVYTLLIIIMVFSGIWTQNLMVIAIVMLIRLWMRKFSSDSDQSKAYKVTEEPENVAPLLYCTSTSRGRVQTIKKWENLVKTNESQFCNCPRNVTFIFVTNMKEPDQPLAERVYRWCKCPFVHLRVTEMNQWTGLQWNAKYKVPKNH